MLQLMSDTPMLYFIANHKLHSVIIKIDRLKNILVIRYVQQSYGHTTMLMYPYNLMVSMLYLATFIFVIIS